MTLYRGTVAVVTGAASGIGKALANNTIPKSQIIADFNKQAKTTAQHAADIILVGIDKTTKDFDWWRCKIT